MFRFLKIRFAARTVEDPVFGVLKLEGGLWTGETLFAPLGRTLQIMVKAGEEGPSESQREHYRQVEERYPELTRAIEQALRQLVRDVGAGPPGDSRFEDFTLESMAIDPVNDGPVRWELWFGWSHDPEWAFTVYLEDWRVVDTGAVH